jgi:hypothetical protein
MSTGASIRRPLGIVLPLNEVKRRSIVDALDKCRGNYCLAAHLLGVGKTTVYRMAKEYNYQPSKVQAAQLMCIPRRVTSSQHSSRAANYPTAEESR